MQCSSLLNCWYHVLSGDDWQWGPINAVYLHTKFTCLTLRNRYRSSISYSSFASFERCCRNFWLLVAAISIGVWRCMRSSATIFSCHTRCTNANSEKLRDQQNLQSLLQASEGHEVLSVRDLFQQVFIRTKPSAKAYRLTSGCVTFGPSCR